MRCNANRYKVPIFYVNQVGAQTELIFDGGSVVVSPDGVIYEEMSYFVEENKVFDLESVVKGGVKNEQPKDKIKDIHDALVLGLQDYFNKLGFAKAVLGLSGGIDSAITLVLAVRALGKDNVRVLMMPSQFSSQHSLCLLYTSRCV